MLTTGTATTGQGGQGRPCVNRFSGLFALRRFFHPILSGRRKQDRSHKQSASNGSRSKSSIFNSTAPVDLDLNHAESNATTSKDQRLFRHSNKPSRTKNKSAIASAASSEMSSEKKFDFIGNVPDPTECPLCLEKLSEQILSNQFVCVHRVCDDCLVRYLCVEIDESRVNLSCPACDQSLHPNVISDALHTLKQNGSDYVRKYEKFMIRRVLAPEPDARWCPAPDCDYIVIASGCASCPCIRCARPDCLTLFCYHCKQLWHPDQTCDSARDQRRHLHQHQKRKFRSKTHSKRSTVTQQQQPAQQQADGPTTAGRSQTSSTNSSAANLSGTSRVQLTGSKGYAFDSLPGLSSSSSSRSSYSSYVDGLSEHMKNRDDLKPCPCCGVLIIKMDDGSCNHMTCSVCGTEFCWLCLKKISDLHYLSPSGCTFWGKKPWSRKKKILWQLGMLVGAPVGIALIAGIAVPTIMIGIPVWFGRKLRARLILQSMGRRKRNLLVTSGVISSMMVSPVVAAVAVGIGVPVLLAYVYGVVPITLCRNGGCGLSTTASGVRIEVDEDSAAASGDEEMMMTTANLPFHHSMTNLHPMDNLSLDIKTNVNSSIGEFSMSPSQGINEATIDALEKASTVGVAGSCASAEPPPAATAAVVTAAALPKPPQGPTAV